MSGKEGLVQELGDVMSLRPCLENPSRKLKENYVGMRSEVWEGEGGRRLV